MQLVASTPARVRGAGDSTLRFATEELARLFLDGLDQETREALEAAGLVRRVTRSLLAAMLAESAPSEVLARLRRVPFVWSGSSGLIVFHVVRSVIAAQLPSEDPVRYHRLRAAAWQQLREELRRGVALEQLAARGDYEGQDVPVWLGELERPLDRGLRGARIAEPVLRGGRDEERLDDSRRRAFNGRRQHVRGLLRVALREVDGGCGSAQLVALGRGVKRLARSGCLAQPDQHLQQGAPHLGHEERLAGERHAVRRPERGERLAEPALAGAEHPSGIARTGRRRLIPLAATLSYVHYEIRIAGALSAGLLGAFPAFSVETCGPETVLVGDLPDQSALHGALAQVEALGLNLLEVRRRPESLEPSDDDSPHQAPVSGSMRGRSETSMGYMTPLDTDIDHVRGAPAGRLIVEYGDYECPYSRRAFREIGLVERRRPGDVRFAFRHFPLTEIHPHALAASAAAEAAALQDRFWEMHELLFHRQKALEDDDLVRYAGELGLDVAAFDRERAGPEVVNRVRRDVESGLASGEVHGTPTLFIDGSVHRGGYDAASLLEALAR